MFHWIQQLDRHVPVRYSVWLLCAVGGLLALFTWVGFGMGGWLALGLALLVALGFRDTRQSSHSILRN
jgi:hypothetical protein